MYICALVFVTGWNHGEQSPESVDLTAEVASSAHSPCDKWLGRDCSTFFGKCLALSLSNNGCLFFCSGPEKLGVAQLKQLDDKE